MLFIICSFIAIFCGTWCAKSRGYADPLRWKIALGIAIGSLIIALVFIPSLLVFAKIFTYLVMPLGLVWITCLVASIISKGAKRMLWITLFILLGLGGNPWIGNFLLHTLERPFKEINPLALEDFDAIIVLGGGTSDPSAFRPQLGYAGDRIMLSVILAQRGNTHTIVLTGSSTAQDHSAQTEALLHSAGVRETEIIRLPEPMNTSQEIQAVKPLIEEAGWKRVGVISSAWHLRRVMKLAMHNEVELIAIPADVRGSWIDQSAHNFIPQATGVMATQLALKEYLGALVGR